MENTCAISGHRTLNKNFNQKKLKVELEKLINQGFYRFFVGMARGFDMACCEELLKLKEKYNYLKVIACIPCVGQEKYYSFEEKLKYYNFVATCDEVKILNEKYVTGCMQMRNRYMVDNSSLLFAYLYKNSGGTYYTVNYAKENTKKIIFL